jgi:hypothetical protein
MIWGYPISKKKKKKINKTIKIYNFELMNKKTIKFYLTNPKGTGSFSNISISRVGQFYIRKTVITNVTTCYG